MHEPDYARELQEQGARLDVTDFVTFVGRVCSEDVAAWLRAADVFALASRREGCCNAVLEALASGLPVVATPVGDNAWFVKEDSNGFLVPVGDFEALAQALEKALKKVDWDRNRISSDLPVGDWNSVARKVLEFFEERAYKGVSK